MASFVATTTLTTAQSLATAESGIVGVNGAVAVSSVGPAVAMTGSASLVVLGAVTSAQFHAISLTNYGNSC